MATWVTLINICLTVCFFAPASKGNVIRPPCYKAGIGQANNLSLCILDEMAVFPDGEGRHKEKRQASVAVKFQRFSLPAEQQMKQVILLPSKKWYHFFSDNKTHGKWNGLIIFSTSKFYCNPWPNIFMSGSNMQP